MLKNRVYYLLLLICLCGLAGCENKRRPDDLNSLRKDFLDSIFEGELQESPFFLNYNMKTVFFSKNLISIFSEFTRYTNLPHESNRYEGRTFCRVNGKFKEIYFNDLFSTPEQQEFVRKYCEDKLKENLIGYFGEDPPLRDALDLKDIKNFLIHERFLVIVFQRYAVAGLYDYPTTLTIPYTVLKGHINPSNILIPLLDKTVASHSFVSSWENILGDFD